MRVSEGREREREKPHERVEYLALIRANATNAYLKVFLFKSMSLALLCASECVCMRCDFPTKPQAYTVCLL